MHDNEIAAALVALIATLLLSSLALAALAALDLYAKRKKNLHDLARLNSRFPVHATVTYSNQTHSSQPTVSFTTHKLPLFNIHKNQHVSHSLKLWVKRNYPFGPFPLLVDGKVV